MKIMIMKEIEKCELWYEPIEAIRGKEKFVCEMTEQNHAFISGLLKKKKPKKIVEIGIAEGGTTAVIMTALSMLGLESEVFSVDLNENFYKDKNLETGYSYYDMREYIKPGKSKHQFFLGKTIGGVIDRIGKEVDFVIIDTTHVLPGEVLDFITILPYLTDDAIVVLHDVDVHYGRLLRNESGAKEDVATRILLSVVAAKRMIDTENKLCNIAAFEINADTYRYIEGCFLALGLIWGYRLSIENLIEYRNAISKKYDKYYVELFDLAVRINRDVFEAANIIKEEKEEFLYKENPLKISKIALYGAGNIGRKTYAYLREMNWCEVVVWVDKQYSVYQEKGMNVTAPMKLAEKDFDCIIIAIENEKIVEEVKEYIMENKIDQGKMIYGSIL